EGFFGKPSPLHPRNGTPRQGTPHIQLRLGSPDACQPAATPQTKRRCPEAPVDRSVPRTPEVTKEQVPRHMDHQLGKGIPRGYCTYPTNRSERHSCPRFLASCIRYRP